jgi:hypothetical protein
VISQWLDDPLDEEDLPPAFYHRAIPGEYPRSELAIEMSLEELPPSLLLHGLYEVPVKITINNHPYKFVRLVDAAMHGISIEVEKA